MSPRRMLGGMSPGDRAIQPPCPTGPRTTESHAPALSPRAVNHRLSMTSPVAPLPALRSTVVRVGPEVVDPGGPNAGSQSERWLPSPVIGIEDRHTAPAPMRHAQGCGDARSSSQFSYPAASSIEPEQDAELHRAGVSIPHVRRQPVSDADPPARCGPTGRTASAAIDDRSTSTSVSRRIETPCGAARRRTCCARHDAVEWLPDLDIDRWECCRPPNLRSDYVRVRPAALRRHLDRRRAPWCWRRCRSLLEELGDTGMVCFGKGAQSLTSAGCGTPAAPGTAFVGAWAEGQDKGARPRRADWADLPCTALAQDVTWEIARRLPWKALPMERVAPVPWYEWRRFFSRLESPRRLLPPNPLTVVLWNVVMGPVLRDQTRDGLLAGRTLLTRLLRMGTMDAPPRRRRRAPGRASTPCRLVRSLPPGQRLVDVPARARPPAAAVTDLRVEAITSGRLAASSRFTRAPTRHRACAASASSLRRARRRSRSTPHCRRRWERRRAVAPGSDWRLQEPSWRRLQAWRVSWRRRDLAQAQVLPGHRTSTNHTRPVLFDVDDAIWLLSPGHERAARAVAHSNT